MKHSQGKKDKIIFLALLTLIVLIPSCFAESAYGPPIKNDLYEISRSKVDRKLPQGEIFTDSIRIKNLRGSEIQISVLASEEISSIVELESAGAIIGPQNYTDLFLTITAKEIGEYSGEIIISGDIGERITTNISVVNGSSNAQFFVKIEMLKKKFTFNDRLDFKVDVQKIIKEEIRNVTFSYSLKNSEENSTHFVGEETKDLIGSLQIIKKLNFPENLKESFYILEVTATYQNETYISSSEFQLKKPFWNIKLLGFLPIWLLAIIIGALVIGITSFIMIIKMIEKRKKYKMQIYTKTLPKKTDRSFWLGKVAETNMTAYLDMDSLTTHAVVA
ncbi:MAG: hypothetical protein ABIH92_04220, partial [Nanoarchaeota archaeon]